MKIVSKSKESLTLFALSILILSLAGCQLNLINATPDIQGVPMTEILKSDTAGVWFDDLVSKRAWEEDQKLKVIDFIIHRLSDPTAEIKIPEVMLNDTEPALIFISVSNGIFPAEVFLGGGASISSAVDSLFTENMDIKPALSPEAWVKVDIVSEVFPNLSFNLEQDFEFERRLYGLAFAEATGIAHLPEELVARTIVDSGDSLRLDNLRKYYAQLGRAQSSIETLMATDTVEVYQFTTWSYFSDGVEIYPLYAGHRMFPELSPQILLQSVNLASVYLTKAVQENGKFVYEYQPKSDTVKTDYNMLRHAGTLYALMEAYEVNNDQDILKSAEKAAAYLVNQLKYCDTPFGKDLCVVEADEAKLGGNGLALVAFAKYTEVTGDDQLLHTMQSLARWILSIQTAEGEFSIHKMRYSSGEISTFISDYYPGEALLGLIRLYQLDKNPAWADAAEKGARWLIEVRDGDLTDKELQHDHWLLYALNEIHRERPQQIFIAHSARLARIIIAALNDQSEYLDWEGSIYKPPRSTPAATRGEGLYAAYQLLRDFGNTEQANVILTAWETVVKFELYNQIYPEKAMYFDNPPRVMGAFHESLDNYSIRIDFVQHNLSSIIGYYKIQKERN